MNCKWRQDLFCSGEWDKERKVDLIKLEHSTIAKIINQVRIWSSTVYAIENEYFSIENIFFMQK